MKLTDNNSSNNAEGERRVFLSLGILLSLPLADPLVLASRLQRPDNLRSDLLGSSGKYRSRAHLARIHSVRPILS